MLHTFIQLQKYSKIPNLLIAFKTLMKIKYKSSMTTTENICDKKPKTVIHTCTKI